MLLAECNASALLRARCNAPRGARRWRLLTAVARCRHRARRARFEARNSNRAVETIAKAAMDSVAGHRVSPRGGRHQSDAGPADRASRPWPAFCFPGTSSIGRRSSSRFTSRSSAGVYGVFLSFDLFLLFVFYELAIIPKYFLIAIWGSTRQGIRRDEAGALFVRRQRDGAGRIDRGLCGRRAARR